jgi:hypothetical protein
VSRRSKRDKRVNEQYDERQSVWQEGVEPEDALRRLLDPPKPDDEVVEERQEA